MAGQDPGTEPAGTEPQPNPPAGGDGGPKGEPDHEAANKRLTTENANLKQANDDLQKQLDALNAGLAKALTEDDVKAAVQTAQDEAKKAADAAEAAWKEREKALVVENALIAAGCTDTVAAIAHLDLAQIEVAKDGHVSGLDVAKSKESYPHLFDAGAVVSSAATPGGPAKKMTKGEIMGIKDPAERRAKIAEHMDLFE
mgnify:CR=1 FL=1